jgi:dipeptidyl aminopeptidase/acylaminoacyl peptidase
MRRWLASNHIKWIQRLTLLLGCFAAVAFKFISPIPSSAQTDATGKLVFTDVPPSYTAYVYDLASDTQQALTPDYIQDFGRRWPIDETHVLVDLCFARNYCWPEVRGIVNAQDLDRFEIARQLWQEDYGPPSWSPDGKYIAFAKESGPHLLVFNAYVMNSDGTDMVDLTPNDYKDGFDFIWSPDNAHLAFTCSGNYRLCIAARDGSSLKRVTVANAPISTIAWSPDGASIALVIREISGYQLFIIDADGSNPRRLLPTERPWIGELAWSPNSTQIAFVSGDQENNIGELYFVNPDGTNLHDLSQSNLPNEFSPVWSPDGSHIAFFSFQDSGIIYLYTIDEDGSELRRWTDNKSFTGADTPPPVLFWLP